MIATPRPYACVSTASSTKTDNEFYEVEERNDKRFAKVDARFNEVD